MSRLNESFKIDLENLARYHSLNVKCVDGLYFDIVRLIVRNLEDGYHLHDSNIEAEHEEPLLI